MMMQQSAGTVGRAEGIPPKQSPSPASHKGHTPRRGVRGNRGYGDRWSLLNAIVDRLDWMPDGERLVLFVLFRHADANGKAWPGQTRIANAIGCHQTTGSRRLEHLVGWGVLEVVRRGHKGSRKAGVLLKKPRAEWPALPPFVGRGHNVSRKAGLFRIKPSAEGPSRPPD